MEKELYPLTLHYNSNLSAKKLMQKIRNGSDPMPSLRNAFGFGERAVLFKAIGSKFKLVHPKRSRRGVATIFWGEISETPKGARVFGEFQIDKRPLVNFVLISLAFILHFLYVYNFKNNSESYIFHEIYFSWILLYSIIGYQILNTKMDREDISYLVTYLEEYIGLHKGATKNATTPKSVKRRVTSFTETDRRYVCLL